MTELRAVALVWAICPLSVGVVLVAVGLQSQWWRLVAIVTAILAALVGTAAVVATSRLNMTGARGGPLLCAVASTVTAISLIMIPRKP